MAVAKRGIRTVATTRPPPAMPPVTAPPPTSSRRPGPSARRYATVVAVAWAVVLLVVCVRIGTNPRHQSVYAADYARAGQHWFQGREIYRESHHFLYSPLTAEMLVPFGLLPDAVGGVVWRLASTAAFLAAGRAWLRGSGGEPSAADTATVFLLLLPLTIGNINIGQMNLLVFAAVAAAVVAVRREQWNLAALAIAAGGFLKIYPLAVGGLLVVLYPRQLLWRVPAALALLFAVSLVLQRPAYAWGEYRVWIERLGTDDRLEIGLDETWRDFGYLLKLGGLNLSPAAYRIMEAAAGALLAAFCWAGQRFGRWEKERLLGAVLSLGCAWMVLFGPATEAATYVLLALPVCAAVVAAWQPAAMPGEAAGTALKVALAGVYALLLIADAGNSWLHGGRHVLLLRSLQPVAALGFAAAVVWWLTRRRGATCQPPVPL